MENKMSPSKGKIPLIVLIILWSIMQFISLWALIYGKQWFERILILNIILLLFLIVFVYSRIIKPSVYDNIVKEKKIKDDSLHFKCPKCKGFFAVKKSKSIYDGPLKLTCPACGTIGTIPISPKLIIAKIPDEKSINTDFKCSNCGEQISIFTEGTKLFNKVKLFSCPCCNTQQPLKKI